MARGAPRNGNGKRLATQQSVNAAVKAICDINDLIEAKGKEVAEAIAALRGLTTSRGE